MKIVLKSMMLSAISMCLMTILTLGIQQISAQDLQKQPTQNSESMARELSDLFFAAARTGNTDVIAEFLKHGFPVNIQNDKGFTPLMMATYYGHANIVNILLEHGADRCLRDAKGHTALMGAIVKAEWSIAKQLRRVDCDTAAQQIGQLTAEEFAKVFGQNEKLSKIIYESK